MAETKNDALPSHLGDGSPMVTIKDARAYKARLDVRQAIYREMQAIRKKLSLQKPPVDAPEAVQILFREFQDSDEPPTYARLPKEAIWSTAMPPEFHRPDSTKDSTEGLNVCIVGAGISGLYIALILESLDISNLTYKILESSNRIGGRLFTFEFTEDNGDMPDNPTHNYYDVGAMRFPKIPPMKRAFDLFRTLEVPLAPYLLSSERCPRRFNDVTVIESHEARDPFHVGRSHGGQVQDEAIDGQATLEKHFSFFKAMLKRDLETCATDSWSDLAVYWQSMPSGWQILNLFDDYSTRDFLRHKGLSFHSVQWLETVNTSTGLFNQALTESVLDSLDFDYEPNAQWWRIKAGADTLVEKIEHRILRTGRGTLEKNKSVKKAWLGPGPRNQKRIFVSTGETDGQGQEKTEAYSAVFSTTTLPCLQRMDLEGLNLHPAQKDAIRCLNYDQSVKVAVRFRHPWWYTKCGINGGTATTDLPLRTCVYPSYENSIPEGPCVLLVSYTWAQDATRIGSLFQNSDEQICDPNCELMQLIFHDLWLLHKGHRLESIDDIRGHYMAHHAYSWMQDPNMSGAFALFGPGQFRHSYPFLTRPAADSRFHIVGEASSTNHAWVVGALNSAYMAVHKFLYREGLQYAIQQLERDWGFVEELETGPDGVEHLQILLGMLPPEYQFRVGDDGGPMLGEEIIRRDGTIQILVELMLIMHRQEELENQARQLDNHMFVQQEINRLTDLIQHNPPGRNTLEVQREQLQDLHELLTRRDRATSTGQGEDHNNLGLLTSLIKTYQLRIRKDEALKCDDRLRGEEGYLEALDHGTRIQDLTSERLVLEDQLLQLGETLPTLPAQERQRLEGRLQLLTGQILRHEYRITLEFDTYFRYSPHSHLHLGLRLGLLRRQIKRYDAILSERRNTTSEGGAASPIQGSQQDILRRLGQVERQLSLTRRGGAGYQALEEEAQQLLDLYTLLIALTLLRKENQLKSELNMQIGNRRALRLRLLESYFNPGHPPTLSPGESTPDSSSSSAD